MKTSSEESFSRWMCCNLVMKYQQFSLDINNLHQQNRKGFFGCFFLHTTVLRMTNSKCLHASFSQLLNIHFATQSILVSTTKLIFSDQQ